MNKKIILPLIMILILAGFVSAAQHTVTVKGEAKTPDNRVDLIYDAGVYGEQGQVTAQVDIDRENGNFEIKDYTFDDTIIVNGIQLVNSMTVGAIGNCYNHMYYIKWQNNQYEVFDAYAPEKGVILSTKESTIDLGILKEDKSNQIMVDSDTPILFNAYDMNGNEVAAKGGYGKFTGMSDVFMSKTRYRIVIQDEKGKSWETTVTTGNYCESTRIIKRKNLMIAENFPNNSFPPIGFFRNMGLWFKGIFS